MSTEASLVTRYKIYCDYSNPHPVGKAITNGRFRYWEIAVGVPIPNNHFSYYTKIRKILYASCTAVATSIQIQCTASAEAYKVRECLDLTIGNANSGGYAKLTAVDDSSSAILEISRVTAPTVSGTVVTLHLAVVTGAAFADTAIFQFYTPKLAEGWDFENNYVSGGQAVLNPYGLNKILPAELDNMNGKVNAQMISIRKPLSDDAFGYVVFSATLQDDIHRWINKNYVYRMGMRYTLNWREAASVNDEVVIYFHNMLLATPTNRDIRYHYNDSEYLADKYFLVNSAPIDGANHLASLSNIRGNASYRKLGLIVTPATSTTGTLDHYIGIEDFWFEHSGGAEIYSADTSLGCLLLPVPPNRDSVEVGYDTDEIDVIRTENNSRFAFNSHGNPNQTRKYFVKGSFQDIPMSQYQKLKILEGFQNDGFLLNLHPHFIELPEVLTGYMKISNQKKTGFDFTRMSFDFEFQEA